MAQSMEQMARAMIRGRITRKPEVGRTMAGTLVCRVIVEKTVGPASRPVRMALYVKGELAKRCGFNLFPGDLIEAEGEIGPLRAGIGHQELLVADGGVRLRERGTGAAA